MHVGTTDELTPTLNPMSNLPIISVYWLAISYIRLPKIIIKSESFKIRLQLKSRSKYPDTIDPMLAAKGIKAIIIPLQRNMFMGGLITCSTKIIAIL